MHNKITGKKNTYTIRLQVKKTYTIRLQVKKTHTIRLQVKKKATGFTIRLGKELLSV